MKNERFFSRIISVCIVGDKNPDTSAISSPNEQKSDEYLYTKSFACVISVNVIYRIGDAYRSKIARVLIFQI